MANDQSPDLLILRSRVPADAHGRALLDYLAGRFPYHPREQWQRQLAAGNVTRNGSKARPTDPVHTGDEIAYHKDHSEPWVDDRIGMLHEEPCLVVVDKPAHLPMHADGPFVRATLVNRLRERLADPALTLVHRLDRETSGVCVLARTAIASASLHGQFERGVVGKVYLAVVRGVVAGDFEVDAPIGHARDSQIAIRRAAGPTAVNARPARTRFTVIERGQHATLLRCDPSTGRTHQIRVHLESVGHAILGDKLYGHDDGHYLEFVRAVKRTGDPRAVAAGEPDRQLLHASSLTFAHPTRGEPVTFTAPLPPEFAPWLQQAIEPAC